MHCKALKVLRYDCWIWIMVLSTRTIYFVMSSLYFSSVFFCFMDSVLLHNTSISPLTALYFCPLRFQSKSIKVKPPALIVVFFFFQHHVCDPSERLHHIRNKNPPRCLTFTKRFDPSTLFTNPRSLHSFQLTYPTSSVLAPPAYSPPAPLPNQGISNRKSNHRLQIYFLQVPFSCSHIVSPRRLCVPRAFHHYTILFYTVLYESRTHPDSFIPSPISLTNHLLIPPCWMRYPTCYSFPLLQWVNTNRTAIAFAICG